MSDSDNGSEVAHFLDDLNTDSGSDTSWPESECTFKTGNESSTTDATSSACASDNQEKPQSDKRPRSAATDLEARASSLSGEPAKMSDVLCSFQRSDPPRAVIELYQRVPEWSAPARQVSLWQDVLRTRVDMGPGSLAYTIRTMKALVAACDSHRAEISETVLEHLLRLCRQVSSSGGDSDNSSSVFHSNAVKTLPVDPARWPGTSFEQDYVKTAGRVPRLSSAASVVDLAQHAGASAINIIGDQLKSYGVCICAGLMGDSTDSTGEHVAARIRQELTWAKDRAELFRPSLKTGKHGEQVPRDDLVLWLDGVNDSHRENLPHLLAIERKLHQLGAAFAFHDGIGPLAITSRSSAMVSCYDSGGAQYQPHLDNPRGSIAEQRESQSTDLGSTLAPMETRYPGDDGRRLTAIYYPNERDWSSQDGGSYKFGHPKHVHRVVRVNHQHINTIHMFVQKTIQYCYNLRAECWPCFGHTKHYMQFYRAIAEDSLFLFGSTSFDRLLRTLRCCITLLQLYK